METVVGVEGSDEEKFEDSVIDNLIYNASPPKQVEDPVVYKLVRVEGDGRLVPATDDEIMEVADLLKVESIDMDIVTDTEKNLRIAIEESSDATTTLLESSGFSQSEKDKANAVNINSIVQENALLLVSETCEINRYSDAGECSNPLDPKMGSELSPPTVCGSLKPDFSKLKGEVCLDNLSIRELHETFRATFGRETTVKDKAWLKRRIMMGLTNTCDVSMTNFIIKDSQVLVAGNEGNSNEFCGSAEFSNPVKVVDETNKSSAINSSSHQEDSQAVSLKRTRSNDLVDSYRSDSLNQEETTAKRVRKPTRRYIEELSEVELRDRSGRLTSLCRGSGQPPPKLYATTVKSVRSDGKTFVIRPDPFAGIQVPCVSRLRRSRPRKDVMSLMKFHHIGLGAATRTVKKALHSYQSACESENNYARGNSIPKQLAEEPEKHRHRKAIDKTEQDQSLDRRESGSAEDICSDKVVTVPTAKGGIRRKHHRAWTLSEVKKLVDGVSRYGAGRWSEIKRLAFASYSYRTSVDLKDKWRNLLKAANFASAPTDLMNSRKHAATPIPAPILSRVRELAEINGQAPLSNLSSSKVGIGGRSANGSAPGYL